MYACFQKKYKSARIVELEFTMTLPKKFAALDTLTSTWDYMQHLYSFPVEPNYNTKGKHPHPFYYKPRW